MCLLLCLWWVPKGVLRICGDSGYADDKHHGTRLMEVLGADRSEGGAASGSLRDTLAQIRAGCAQGLGRTIQSVTPNVEEHLFHAPLLQVVSIPMPTYRATGTQSHQSSPPRGPRRIRALRWLLCVA